MKYRKKPVVIDAFEYYYCEWWSNRAPSWFNDAVDSEDIKILTRANKRGLEIETLEGTMKAEQGEYIIRGVQGEIYPCKPDIFEATYEEVKDDELG